jgi:hypothetical protein
LTPKKYSEIGFLLVLGGSVLSLTVLATMLDSGIQVLFEEV